MNLHCSKREVGVNNLVFYAPSTITVISGRERSGKRKLICIVQRENTCADLTGCFVLFQELEEEVNLHYEELVMDKSHDQLLASQLQTLLVGFDSTWRQRYSTFLLL